jgi:hypothetical protein
VLKRAALPALLLAVLAITGCKKSEGTKIKNFFGASPTVTEVSITKTRRHFDCNETVPLCCADPPFCSCCCIPDSVHDTTVDIDLFTASAKIADADGVQDILVVLLRFFDPPKGTGGSVSEISLEMFDTGPTRVGVTSGPPPNYDVLSGDQTAGDGVYTRRFYFGSTTIDKPDACIQDTDALKNNNGIYNIYKTSRGISPSSTLDFQFLIQAIDLAGNATNSADTTVPVQGTFVEEIFNNTTPCGPPLPNGGCQPSTP